MSTETYHLGDLLSVTTDRLLSPDHIHGVARLLTHMTGDTLMTHQLPLASDAMVPELLAQFPWLADVKPPRGADSTDLIAWLSRAVSVHGEHHVVQPAPHAWGDHDPMRDYHNQYPGGTVLPVVLDDDQ